MKLNKREENIIKAVRVNALELKENYGVEDAIEYLEGVLVNALKAGQPTLFVMGIEEIKHEVKGWK